MIQIRTLVSITRINSNNAVIPASYRRLSFDCRSFHSVRRYCHPRRHRPCSYLVTRITAVASIRSWEGAYRDTTVRRMPLITNSSTTGTCTTGSTSTSHEYRYSNPPYTGHDDIFVHGPKVRKKVQTIKTKKMKQEEEPETVVPPMKTIEQALEKMNTRFDEIEKEHFGPKRGIMTVKWLAGKKCEKLHKLVTTKLAKTILNSWIYCRHALQHGHYQLNDMSRTELNESLLGKGTKTKVPDRDARFILKELFRYGQSNLFDQYKTRHLDKMKLLAREAAAVERNKIGGIPKIRSIATVEEMSQHGYSPDEIDAEIVSRMKRLKKRQQKRKDRDMPAYLRHEVSGAKRQEARKVQRLLQRRERKLLQRENGYDGSSSASDSEEVVKDNIDDDDDDGSDSDEGRKDDSER